MPLSHIVMQVALCNSMLRLKPGTPVGVRVQITDRVNRTIYKHAFRMQRDIGNTVPVEFDIPWGIYRATVQTAAAHTTCGATTYFAAIQGLNRTLAVSVQHDAPPGPAPELVYGSAPFSFSYVQPTVLLFDKSDTCNGPIGNPIDADVVTQNDSDGYYASVFPSAAMQQHWPVVIAVRLTDSHGGYHYIHIPTKMLGYSGGWPSAVTLNVNEDLIDYVADKPEDTLLCPKMYETITG